MLLLNTKWCNACTNPLRSQVYETIEKNEVRVAERDRRDVLRTEWHQVAAVCDRFLLAVFLLSTALATFLVLFSSPRVP